MHRDGEQSSVAGIMEHIEEAAFTRANRAARFRAYPQRDTLTRFAGLEDLETAHVPAQDTGRREARRYTSRGNTRASRTIPSSRRRQRPPRQLAAKVMWDGSLRAGIVRAARQPNSERSQSSPSIAPRVRQHHGTRMKSTGEVMGIDDDFGRAFAKRTWPPRILLRGKVFSRVDRTRSQPAMHATGRLSLLLVATPGTRSTSSAGIENWRRAGRCRRHPNISTSWLGRRELIINPPSAWPPHASRDPGAGHRPQHPGITTIPAAGGLTAAARSVRDFRVVRSRILPNDPRALILDFVDDGRDRESPW